MRFLREEEEPLRISWGREVLLPEVLPQEPICGEESGRTGLPAVRKALFSPHISESGLCLGCWRKHAGEEGLCFKPKLNGWSWRHGACVRCLDTSSPHKTRGVCSRCYSKEQGSRRRGSWGKKCLICGEARAIARCHIVPKRLGGPVDGWNVLYLCATHHHCFDEDELTDAEWEKIKRKVRLALGRVDLSGVKRYGRQGLPWALRRIA